MTFHGKYGIQCEKKVNPQKPREVLVMHSIRVPIAVMKVIGDDMLR